MNSPTTLLLEEQLQQLQLAALQQHYRTQAQAATRDGWPYEAYLAALIQQEVDRRFGNRRQRRIKDAHFPLLKELADFDFTLLPQFNRQKVLELAQGHYLAQAETVLFVGNPGLGKTHIATGLGLAACRQDRRVRFVTVTQLINELQEAQAIHQLPHYLAKALRHQIIILDEFGYVPFSPTWQLRAMWRPPRKIRRCTRCYFSTGMCWSSRLWATSKRCGRVNGGGCRPC